MTRSGRSIVSALTACATSSWETRPLRCTSVMKPMRRPASAGGSPTTRTVARVTSYIGFDPTASSLHVGNLMTLMALARLQRFGHFPIAVVGGGTGMIGDPSGKSQERTLLALEQIEENVASIRGQLSRFLDFESPTNPARIANNADWLAGI